MTSSDARAFPRPRTLDALGMSAAITAVAAWLLVVAARRE
jgi:hypothetical protein